MNFLDQLNQQQREAVVQTTGPLLILAGAGSGKTRVIAYRIAYLLAAGLARPHEILAVTFTNKAADEMRARVETLLGAACDRVWISTFHSMCARLLRREAPAIGLTRDFVIYDTADQLAAMKLALKELQVDESMLPPRSVLARISQAKNRLEALQEMAGGFSGSRDDLVRRAAQAYQRALSASNALDFDDLLVRTVELFDSSRTVRDRYSQQFRFIMVDEYQDTNRPQYLLIRQLADAHRNVCVVGDPDQSIYGWRGADLRNILDFERDFPEARVVRLERNYRSTAIILDAASALISRNRQRKEKRLWTDRQGGERVTLMLAADELEEAGYIVGVTQAALDAEPSCRVAVLYRTNAQSRVLEDAFRRAGVPYRIVGSVRFYERKEIKDVLAYLRLLLNPHDDVSLRRVINVPARGIGKAVMEAVEAVPLLAGGWPASAAGTAPSASLWSRLCRGLDAGVFTPRAAASLAAFRRLIEELSDASRQEPVPALLARVLDRSGYLQALRDEHSEEAEGRIENLAELVSAAREQEARDPDAGLRGFVDQLSLLSDADEAEGAADARAFLMTIHCAKGLEFPVVIIAGLEEGLFPHSRSIHDEAALEEERRLCYVAMTRAQSKLVMTGAWRRRLFGEYRASAPSRFLHEVPGDLIDGGIAAAPPFFEPGFEPTRAHRAAATRTRTAAGGASGRRKLLDEVHEPAYAYESEDQSCAGFRLGMRVRHPTFGEGTIIGIEPAGRDVKVSVRFADVGAKRLLASYAKLEPA